MGKFKSVKLEYELWRQVNKLSADIEKPIQEIVNEAVRKYIGSKNKKEV